MKSISYVFGILAALFATVSYAQFTPGIFSYGNGDILFVIMQGAADVLNSNAFRRMIGFFLLVLMIFSITTSFTSGRLKPELFLYWIFGATIMYTVVLNTSVAKMDIVIHDLQGTAFATNRVVPDVPIYIAFPAVVTSEMGRVMTELVESTYTGFLPDQLRMREMGRFNLGAQIVEDMGKVVFTDPPTTASFSVFMRDCVIPEIYEGSKSINQILTSTDIIADLAPSNLARMTFFYGTKSPEMDAVNSSVERPGGGTYPIDEVTRGQGVLTTCDQSWRRQEERFDVFGPRLLTSLNSSMVYQTQLLDDAVSNTALWVYGEGAGRGTDGTGAKLYTRAAVANMFTNSAQGVVSESGGQGVIAALGTAEAEATQKQSWIVSASVFSNMFSYLFAVIQTFFYAIAPFVLVLFVIPKIGGKAIFSFFGLMVWLSLWEPFMSIVHFISLFWMKSLASKGSALLDPAASLQESLSLTPASMAYMTEAGSTLRAATDFLATMVPILTYGLVKGGEFAFTNFVKDAAAPAASGKVAGNIATDSFSYGTRSLNNTSGNKYDLTSTMGFGQKAIQYDASAGAAQSNTDMGGRNLIASGQKLGGTVTTKGSVGRDQKAEIMDQVAESSGFTLQAGQSEVMSNMIERSSTGSLAVASSEMSSLVHKSNEATDIASNASAQYVAGLKASASNQSTASANASVGLGGSLALMGMLSSDIMARTGKDIGNFNPIDVKDSLEAGAKKMGGTIAEFVSSKTGGAQQYDNDVDAIAGAQAQMASLQEATKVLKDDPNATFGDALNLAAATNVASAASKEELQALDKEGFFKGDVLESIRDSAMSLKDDVAGGAAFLAGGLLMTPYGRMAKGGQIAIQKGLPALKKGADLLKGVGLKSAVKKAGMAGLVAGVNKGLDAAGVKASTAVQQTDLSRIDRNSEQSTDAGRGDSGSNKTAFDIADTWSRNTQRTRTDLEAFSEKHGAGSSALFARLNSAGVTENNIETIADAYTKKVEDAVTETTMGYALKMNDIELITRSDAWGGVSGEPEKLKNPNITPEARTQAEGLRKELTALFGANESRGGGGVDETLALLNDKPTDTTGRDTSVASNAGNVDVRTKIYSGFSNLQGRMIDVDNLSDERSNVDASDVSKLTTFLKNGAGTSGAEGQRVLSGVQGGRDAIVGEQNLVPEGGRGFRSANFSGKFAATSEGGMSASLSPEGSFQANNGASISSGFVDSGTGQIVAYPGSFQGQDSDLRQLLEDEDLRAPENYKNLSDAEKARYTVEDFERDLSSDMSVAR